MTAALLTARPTWEALEAHSQKLRGVHLRTLFAEDPKRGERLTAEAAGVFLDLFSCAVGVCDNFLSCAE